MGKRLQTLIATVQSHASSWWYTPALALLAAADAFVIIIPTDGLLVGASMAKPKRWAYAAVVVTLGSTIGALVLAAVLQRHGLPVLQYLNPGIEQTEAWAWSVKMMADWGRWALFFVAVSPIMQQPAVALAALAGMPLLEVFYLVFSGRLLKYGFLSWLATHAPGMLSKLWGIQNELKEAGVQSDQGPDVVKPTPKLESTT
jgi:membrane protein YqaA with SNARE-associated domain